MGMRFRKSIRLGKGVRINLNKKSVGISVGGKGARMTINSSGRTTTTLGVPGTGLSYTHSEMIGKNSASKKSLKEASGNDHVDVQDLSKNTHCVYCGKQRGWFERFSLYGFCKRCNSTVREYIKGSLERLKEWVPKCAPEYPKDASPETVLDTISAMLDNISTLEEMRPKVPFFKSSTLEYRTKLMEYQLFYLNQMLDENEKLLADALSVAQNASNSDCPASIS